VTRRQIWLLAAVAGVLVLLVVALRGVLAALALSAFLAYVFEPWVGRLHARGVPRAAGALACLAVMIALVVGLAFAVLPALVAELAALIEQLPEFAETVRTVWLPRLQALSPVPLRIPDDEALLELLEQARPALRSSMLSAVVGVSRGTAGFIAVLVQLALIPVLAFYALRDAPTLRRNALAVVPADLRSRVVEVTGQVDRVISAYLRGQLTVCLVVAVLYSIGFSLAGVPFAVLAGSAAGFLTLIPYAGPVMGLALALGLSIFEHGLGLQLAYTAGAFALVNGLEGTVITPNLVGDRLGLHPLAVVLGLVAGGQLAGLVGMLVAVPLLAVGKIVVWPALRDALAAPRGPDDRPGAYA
jgi:predicted PurR-regulated permease PerM